MTDSSQWHAVAETIPHPNSSHVNMGGLPRAQYDIALIRLADELIFDRYSNETGGMQGWIS